MTEARRSAFAALSVVGGLLVAPLIVELGVRTWPPQLRTQLVGPRVGVDVELLDGVPVWQSRYGSAERQNADCRSQPAIAAIGSSILYGSGVEPEQTWSELVQARRPELCIHNLSQNAFSFDAKEAVVKRYVAAYQPELVYWEVWATDVDAYTMIGDTAWRLSGFPLDAAGTPDTFGLPFNSVLFRHSHTWQWLTINNAKWQPPGAGSPWPRIGERMLEVAARVAEQGGQLVAVFCPVLDRSFAESVDQRTDMERELIPVLEGAGVPYLRLAEGLAGQDYMALRLDPCCHYSPEGHVAVAEVIEADMDRRRE